MNGVRVGVLVGFVAAVLGVGLGAPAAAQTAAQDLGPVCGTEAGTGGTDDGVLRVGSYNILHTQPDLADRAADVRIELITAALADADVDVVGMQEVVWSDNHGSFAQRIAAGLAATTGDDWTWCWYASNPHCPEEPDQEPGGRGGDCSQGIAAQARSGDSPWFEGVALLTRFEVTDTDAHRLVGRAEEVPLCAVEQPDDPLCAPTLTLDTRTIVWARLDTPFGPMDYATSHLANHETSLTPTTQLLQVNDALNHLDGLVTDDPTPDVYVGDFNTEEGSDVWQAVIDAGFLDSYREAEPDGDGFTSDQELDAPAATVYKRIDFVFARPGSCALTPTDGTVIGTAPAPFEDGVVWPSDHLGVAVTLDLGGACASGAPTGSGTGSPGDGSDAGAADAGDADNLPQTGGGAPLLAVSLLVAATTMTAIRRRRTWTR